MGLESSLKDQKHNSIVLRQGGKLKKAKETADGKFQRSISDPQ